MLLLITICVLLGVWIWSQQKYKLSEPPLYPGALPLIGHAHFLLGNSTKLYKMLQETAEYCTSVGGVIAAKIGPRTIYVLTDPEDSLTVSNACLEKDEFYNFGKSWIGNGLLTSKVSIWKDHRKLIIPAFSSKVLNNFLDIFNNQARRLVTELSGETGKEPFNHWTYMHNNSFETICLTALGVDYNDKEVVISEYEHAAYQLINVIMDRFQKVWWHNDSIYQWSNLKKEEDKLVGILHRISDTVLKNRKAEYYKNRQAEEGKKNSTLEETKFKPFMDLLLELSIEQEVFNDKEIRDHIDTIIVAGSDTVSTVLLFGLILIGSYPHVQEKIYQELREVIGNDDRDVTKDDLSQLVYMEAVLKEVMRMTPVAPVIARALDKDIKLRNCTLSAGRTCFMILYGLHRHPSWGPDVYDFKPERWLDPTTLPKCPGLYSAFSLGKRNCIGRAYSYMSMKTTLAHLLRHYIVRGDYSNMEVKLDILLKPGSGYFISLEKRKN